MFELPLLMILLRVDLESLFIDLDPTCESWISNAWDLKAERFRKKGVPVWSFQSQMIQFTIWLLVFVRMAFAGFSVWMNRLVWEIPVFIFAQSLHGFLLLEIVNYPEH